MLPYRSRLSVLVFLTPPVLLFGGGVLLPIVQSLVLSFYKWDGITNMQFVGIDNYIKMFSADPTFWKAFVNQLVYLVICVVIQMGLGLGVALLLLTITRGREVLKVLYLMPAVISTTAIALLFQRIYSFDPKGLVNTILGMVGLDALEKPWLSNIHTVLTAVSIPEGWRFLGLYTIIFYAALLSVPRELEEAAQDPFPPYPARVGHDHGHGRHLRPAGVRYPISAHEWRARAVIRTCDDIHVQDGLCLHELRVCLGYLRVHRARVSRCRRLHLWSHSQGE